MSSTELTPDLDDLTMTTATKTTKLTAKSATEINPTQVPVGGLSYTAEDGRLRGYCYCCGRAGFLLGKPGTRREGRLSRHGFVRPRWMGYEHSACSGTYHTPEETLRLALANSQRTVAGLRGRLAGDWAVIAREGLRDRCKSSLRRARQMRNYNGTVYDYRTVEKGKAYQGASTRTELAEALVGARTATDAELRAFVGEAGYPLNRDSREAFARLPWRTSMGGARKSYGHPLNSCASIILEVQGWLEQALVWQADLRTAAAKAGLTDAEGLTD